MDAMRVERRGVENEFRRATICFVASRETMFSSAVEDYAKAIYQLGEHSGGAVTTNALAERLEVTAASASGMVRKLDDLGLVAHVPYKGVKLTAKGAQVALEMLRH